MKLSFELSTADDGSVSTQGELESSAGSLNFNFTFPDMADAIGKLIDAIPMDKVKQVAAQKTGPTE